MRYALLVYGSPEAEIEGPAPADAFEDWEAATKALRAAGALLAGEGLATTETATTVRHRGGERLLTDGPFAETKEQLLGFYLVEATDLDGALAWAGRLPAVTWGGIEVRPVMDGPFSASAS